MMIANMPIENMYFLTVDEIFSQSSIDEIV